MKHSSFSTKSALVIGVMELFKSFRLNPSQAHQILEEVKQLLPSPSDEDVDDTANCGKKVLLSVSVQPDSLIEVQTEVTTMAVPVIPEKFSNN